MPHSVFLLTPAWLSLSVYQILFETRAIYEASVLSLYSTPYGRASRECFFFNFSVGLLPPPFVFLLSSRFIFVLPLVL